MFVAKEQKQFVLLIFRRPSSRKFVPTSKVGPGFDRVNRWVSLVSLLPHPRVRTPKLAKYPPNES